jgi:hypothetical protein
MIDEMGVFSQSVTSSNTETLLTKVSCTLTMVRRLLFTGAMELLD